MLTNLDWIIILFVIHLDAFKVAKIEKLAYISSFNGRTQFEDLGSETFQSQFQALNDVFGGKTLFHKCQTP